MNNLIKEFFAEFLGTTILMLFGLSGSATSVLTNSGSVFLGAVSYAFGAVIAIFFCGPISGAHINPAFTFAFCLIRKCSWRKCPIYMLAQYLGSFVASAIVYGLYFESMEGFDKQHFGTVLQTMDNLTSSVHNSTIPSVTTASIFITLPSPYISLVPAITDQVVSTGLLAFAVLFISDESCYRTPPAIQTLATGFAILSFVVGFNYNCGAILNPARDLSPRIFLSMVGYNRIVFEALDGHFWWAVGIVAPHLGAILGSLLYVLMSKMRSSYVDSSHQLDSIVPALNPERDLIYQKARIVINENIKNLNPSPPHSRY